nr:hypothetical protein [uncultured Mogibacterium sp.]
MRKTTVRKTTKKRRRRAAFLLILLITGIAVLKSGIVTKRIQREETKKAVAAEVEALHEKANRDGIVEETPDPYFIRKQPGYSYPKPKLIQYDSGITHTRRHAMVFLPADYDAAERVEGLSFTESLEPFDATPEEVVKYLKPYIERHFSVKKVGRVRRWPAILWGDEMRWRWRTNIRSSSARWAAFPLPFPWKRRMAPDSKHPCEI